MGPWAHANFDSTIGDLDFGMTSAGGFIDADGNLTHYQLSWFDATPKGNESELADTPPVCLFVWGRTAARLRGVAPPRSREEEWYLTSAVPFAPRAPWEQGRTGALRLRPRRPHPDGRGSILLGRHPSPRPEGSTRDRGATGRVARITGPALETLYGARSRLRHAVCGLLGP